MILPSGVSVLLVDDQPANLLALEAVLSELGATLVRANSGEEALRRVQDADFAAILLDVRMPGMDGFEAARLIRSRPRSRTTPILFVTASDSAEFSVEEAYAMGAVDFLTKPLVPAVLKGKVAFFIELHRSKEELRAAERRAVNERAFLSAVLEAIEDGIVACGPDGVLTLFNRATRQLHGLPQEALPAGEWSRHYDLYRADGSVLPTSEIPLVRALGGEDVRRAEMVVAPKAGRRRTLLASGQSLYDEGGRKLGAVVSMHDVTAQRESEAAHEAALREQVRRQEAEAAAEAIRGSEERVRLATDAAGLGLYMWDIAADRVTWENDRPYEMFGLPRSTEPVNASRFVSDFLAAEDAAAFSRAMAATIATGVPFLFQGRIYRQPDRELRWVEFTGRVLDAADGAPRRVLGTAADITARKQGEDDLRRLAAELAESDKRKTEFLATLAHELRNPLAPLRNGLHLMRLAGSDANAREKTRDMMDRQVGHMVRLIDDLLDIARVSTGKVELKKERVDLRSVITSAVETSMPLIEASRHTLTLRVSDELLMLDVDPTRLAQVLSNLLNNAAKYTPDGGRIELTAAHDASAVVVSVSDTGVGIADDALAQVFQMFTQVGRSMNRSQGGLGIGLSLVRELVELHGGTVSAASAGAGKGSTFSVRLPLAEGTPVVASAAAAPAQAEPACMGFRVLVVDDNADAAESLAIILQMNGHLARVANDGGQAIHVAREFRPEIVFLDIGMPGKNGYQVAQELRGTVGMERAVLVALTGWGAEDDRIRSRDAGFDHHLTKPAEMTAVEQLLSGLAQRPAH